MAEFRGFIKIYFSVFTLSNALMAVLRVVTMITIARASMQTQDTADRLKAISAVRRTFGNKQVRMIRQTNHRGLVM